MSRAELEGGPEGRLAAVISPLRRTLLSAARERGSLPDIPDAQIEVVRALLPSPDGAERGPAELADALHLSRSTVSNLLRAMEADGLVERRRGAGDGRRVVVAASARAIDLFHRFDEAAGELLREALASLDPSDRSAVDAAVPALERLAEALKGASR
ncbi:MarR family winged helix-turn-helix transcriptional regulator [Microbacterium azadirachtae]|uniref:MarR family winged helix-turn-helix transcriptional regulator n=1 Tax=Microbacterium azadirachtae TaxID=582680 RepID=UPI00088DE8FB|nr:MarR family transcriptional regulator [Microbacterium azadirachtae]SDL63191.1 MarR family protein [Microbacterium azadirachtae]SEF92165.1 MarR family protein [Microbacterium azadirachtae]SEF94402.1 MarR family protein [Microbacterium azadirachtae]